MTQEWNFPGPFRSTHHRTINGTIQPSAPKHEGHIHSRKRNSLVGDVLVDCHQDLSGLLEDPLVVPVRVDPGQFSGQSVVFPQEDGVESCQPGLLVVPVVAWEVKFNNSGNFKRPRRRARNDREKLRN